jgi:uncharacterized protein (DUF849 family)
VEKLIIECALNEQVSRADNPRVPISPREVVRDALEAAEAGASIIHFHARDASGEMLHPGTEWYREAMREIRRGRPDLLFYPTYGFSPTPQERFSHVAALADDPQVRLDFMTIDPGAVNYSAWDPARRELGPEMVLSVGHAECRYFFELARQRRMQFSITVRELGHVRHALTYCRMGWIRPPLLFKLVSSERHAWGAPPSPEAVRVFTHGMLPPDLPYRWMTYVEGEAHTEMCRFAVREGGHVRTGIGDNAQLDGKQLSNAEQVERVVRMAAEIGRAVATPAEVRAMLAQPPPGGEAVAPARAAR